MGGKFGFVTFLLVGGIILFLHYRTSSRAPQMTDQAMIVRQAEYQAALEHSRRTGKPVVLDFYADWCGPCRWMQANTWRDPGVNQAMQNFILLPVNIDANRELSHLFGVSGIPHVVVISPDGNIIRTQTGALPPDRFLPWLPEVRLQTTSAQ